MNYSSSPTMILNDIIFQSGEFLNEGGSWLFELLNTVLGAGIGAAVTVFVLFRSFNQTSREEERRRVRFQKEKIKYLRALITTVLADLKLQIDCYNDFAKAIESDPLNLPLLRELPLNELTTIVHKLNQEDYYHSYLGEFGDNEGTINEFSNMMSTLNFIDGNIKKYSSLNLQKSFNYDHERKVKLGSLADKTMGEMSGYLINDKITADHYDFCVLLDKTFIHYTSKKTSESDLTLLMTDFVNVMADGLVEFAPTVPQAHDLALKMKEIRFIYNDIIFQNKNLITSYQHAYVAMKAAYDRLQIIAKRLFEMEI